tara:strand:- start:1697 stop:2455 length:759 start_codon:yes stop_codon:yes gene_type:complete
MGSSDLRRRLLLQRKTSSGMDSIHTGAGRPGQKETLTKAKQNRIIHELQLAYKVIEGIINQQFSLSPVRWIPVLMPRRFIKRFLPNEAKIKAHPSLSRLGSALHNPNLWHLNRNSVSLAFLVGIFCAFLPIPMQMLVAAVLAILIHSNLPISVGLVWITNPLTMPPIFYFTFKVGAWLLNLPDHEQEFTMTFEWISGELSHIWWPLLFGSLVCGLFFSVLSFFSVRLLWAWHVGKSWRQRKQNRLQKKKPKE